MVQNVNPPQTKIPESLAESNPDLFKYLEDTQFHQFQMWRLTINTGEAVEDQGGSTNALVAKLQQQIGSGQFLTCDDGGFTCDNGEFTCDMGEA